MATKKPGALAQLQRLQAERAALDEREAKLRRDAAEEIGAMLLAAGADAIDPDGLKQVVQAVKKLGVPAALARLGGPTGAVAAVGREEGTRRVADAA